MSTIFFSIILPLYNAKKYVAETIESILSQTYTNYEVIIVNDGSTDGSDLIAQRYAYKDTRIKYFSQLNAGICAARNLAILYAKGEYIMFCDHDDIYSPYALESMYKCLKNTYYDVVKCPYTNYVLENDIKHKEYKIGATEGFCSSEELRKDYERLNCFSYSVWNGAYKRELLQQNNLMFDENIRFGMEDAAFNYKLLENSISIFFLNSPFYTHFIRYGQSTSRKFDLNKLEAICYVLGLEKKIVGDKASDEMKIRLMGKYIRSYFVTLSVSVEKLKDGQVRDINRVFKEKINFTLGIDKLILYLFSPDYFTDAMKVILYKLKLFRVLILFVRGQ